MAWLIRHDAWVRHQSVPARGGRFVKKNFFQIKTCCSCFSPKRNMIPILRQQTSLPSRAATWRREIADGLVLYSISILACGATFYSALFENYVNVARAQEELALEKITIISLFLGIASAVFGVRRLTDQFNERKRRLAAEQNANSLSPSRAADFFAESPLLGA